MSRRTFRKLYPDTATLPPPLDSDDDDFEPASNSNNKFGGLNLSSSVDSEQESASAVISEQDEDQENNRKKKNKKKRKAKKNSETCSGQTAEVHSDVDSEPSTTNEHNSELEHVELKKSKKNKKHKKNKKRKSEELQELDETIMSMQEEHDANSTQNKDTSEIESVPILKFMVVEQKYLNAENEHIRRFGPITPENGNSSRVEQRSRQAVINRLLNRKAIVPISTYAPTFQRNGLSMSVEREEKGYFYFTFDHGEEYRWIHRNFLVLYKTNASFELQLESAQAKLHVEGLLECADMLFESETNIVAIQFVEKVIAFLQYIAHPKFILTDPRTRLEYKYRENRTFHVALLKYLYILTNRACHRTALEMAKILLNLDPSDPLAVLLVIDMLALRAREHEWLVEAVSHWNTEKDAGFLFNTQYSHAMAQFHISKKSGDVSKADQLLQKAMIRFPIVVLKILECASVRTGDHLKTHPLFAKDQNSVKLRELIYFYAKFTWTTWREQPVLEWFLRNANELANKYDNDPETRKLAEELANHRLNLFQWFPDEVCRHLCVIGPMSKLLVDGAVPKVKSSISSDPHPAPNTVDRYYRIDPTVTDPNQRMSLLDLLSSLLGIDTRGPE